MEKEKTTNIPHAIFSVDEARPKERYGLWSDSISVVFDVDAKKDVRDNNFQASVDAHMLGPLMLARTTTGQQSWDRTELTMVKDGLDHIMIQLYESGHTICNHSNGSSEMPEDGLLVYDMAQEVRAKTDNFTNLSLIIPRQMLIPSLKNIDDQHMRELTANEPMVQLLRDHMLSLKRLARSMSSQQAAELAPATASLVSACLNTSESKTHNGQLGVSTAQTIAAKQFIESHIKSPHLTPDFIAKNTGISRSKLYELFRSYNGIATYIKERRLNLALKHIIDPKLSHLPIISIALDCGFTSDSDFSRSFKKHFGCTPKDARQQGMEMAHSSIQDQHGLDRSYEHWLKTMQ